MNKSLHLFRRALVPLALAAMALAVISLPAAATGPLADAAVYAGGVDFLPMVAHRGGTITVTGPTMTYQRSFGAGERPSIDLFDPEGQLLPDGIYTYRLQLTPSRLDAGELRRVARQDGGVDPDAWPAVSGSFAIRGGLVADPDLAEARPARRESPRAALPADLGAVARADRAADDSDQAVAAGRAPVAGPAATVAPAGRTIPARSDAGATTRAPAARALNEDPPTPSRSYPTEGRNGRDQ